MRSSTVQWVVGIAILAGLALAAGIISLQRSDEIAENKANKSSTKMIEVGGVLRPQSDVVSNFDRERLNKNAGIRRAGLSADSHSVHGEDDWSKRNGMVVPIAQESENPQVAKVSQAMRTLERPEQYLPMVLPAAFDYEAYKANPQEYLDTIEPGRVWQAAQPGEGVPALASLSRANYTIVQKESIRLKVKTLPEAPVTFTSFDSGIFQNELSSVTVAANDQGVAEAVYTATAGVISDVNIGAASPVATGLLRFRVFVQPGDSGARAN